MGQPLPLPNRIPQPTGYVASEFDKMGIKYETGDEKYVSYTLPDGWSMKDKSWREDLPNFAIVDTDGMIRAVVSGSWKETYDNRLSINIPDELELFEKPKDEVIPSETSVPAIVGKIAGALVSEKMGREY
jgi:hypothetical protein